MKLFRNEARGWSVMTSAMYKSSDTQGGRVAGGGRGMGNTEDSGSEN